MQIAAETTTSQSLLSSTLSEFSGPFRQSLSSRHKVIRRNGVIVGFEPFKVSVPATNAFPDGFPAVNSGQPASRVEPGLQVVDNRVSAPLALQCGMRGRGSGCGTGDLG